MRLSFGVDLMENKHNKPSEPRQPIAVVKPRSHFVRTSLILLVIAILAVGFWRNWFVFSSHESPESEKVDLKLSVDTAKIKADTKLATEKTKEEAAKLSAKVKEEAQQLRKQSP
jgi:predicted negative regulator of RcsB-dependent stress response